MQITKPDDVLLLQGYEKRGDQCYFIATVGYVVEPHGALVTEAEAWKWLAAQFTDEPFDIGLQKRRGTFGVAGAACAPNGQPVKQMAVRVRVGDLEKTLHIQGDRQWKQGLTGWTASEPAPFVRMPVDLTRAYGGPAFAGNPYGKGHAADSGDYAGLALPNIESPDAPVMSVRDRPAVATLGNLAATDPRVATWAGTFDAAWERSRFPWLPDDVDPRYFDRVSQDQCADNFWRGDERWSVEGMHPEQRVVQGALPGLQPQLLALTCAASPWAAAALPRLQRAELRLDTVWLFPESGRQVLLYRGALPVQREDGADIAGLWIDTYPAGTRAPTLDAQLAQWKTQAPHLASRLTAASATPVGAAAVAAATAAGIAAGTATQAAAAGTNGAQAPAADVQREGSTPSAPLAATSPSNDSIAASPLAHSGDLPQPDALDGPAPSLDGAPAASGWDDALWDEICQEYRQAWDEARDMVRKMQEEQASYGVVFPEIEPFVAPAKPGATAMLQTLPSDFAQHLSRQVDDALTEGQRMFESVLRETYPDNPKRVEALLEQARNAAQLKISDQQMEEVLSNLPPELRERGNAEIRALSAHFDDLNRRLAETFDKSVAPQASRAAAASQATDGLDAPSYSDSPRPPSVQTPGTGSNSVAATGGIAAAAAAGALSRAGNESGSSAARAALASETAPSGTGINLQGQTLEQLSYVDADLKQANFNGCQLIGCDFKGADLSAASFEGARIEGCDFSGAAMAGVCLKDMDAYDTAFSGADWRYAQAQRMNLQKCDLSDIDATRADLTNAQLEQCNLDRACLTHAILNTTTLSSVCATNPDFSDTQAEGLRIDSGTALVHASFERASLPRCSLMQSQFPDSRWQEADVSDGLFLACDLSNTQAQRLKARQTVFKDSRIRDADWQQSDLMEASFEYALIERVDVSQSNLHGVQTRTANIRALRVDGALLSATRLLQEHGRG